MAHFTKIDGTIYEIIGGKTMINGTGYNIRNGKTLVDGTGYDIPFGANVRFYGEYGTSGVENAEWRWIEIDGVKQNFEISEPYSQYENYGRIAEKTMLLPIGTVITCCAQRIRANGTTTLVQLELNGEHYELGKYDPGVRYDYVVTKDVDIGLYPTYLGNYHAFVIDEK
jgi:hypothetical protein